MPRHNYPVSTSCKGRPDPNIEPAAEASEEHLAERGGDHGVGADVEALADLRPEVPDLQGYQAIAVRRA